MWEYCWMLSREDFCYISSILALSVANLPCSSLAAANIPFFLTVPLTSLQNCSEVKVALECSLLWRCLFWTLSVICILRVFASCLKKLKSFSLFFPSSLVPKPRRVFSSYSCFTCDSATIHFFRSLPMDLHSHISPIQWFSCTQSLLLPLMFLEETFTFLQCPWDSNLPIPHKLQRLLCMPPQCRFYRETKFLLPKSSTQLRLSFPSPKFPHQNLRQIGPEVP